MSKQEMSAPKPGWTPGPWRVLPELDDVQPSVIVNSAPYDRVYSVAQCGFTGQSMRDRVVERANARLIAAAPALYAALENLVLANTRVHTDDAGAPASERDRAAAAFWDALHDDLGPGGLGMNSDQIRAEMLDRARSALARARGE